MNTVQRMAIGLKKQTRNQRIQQASQKRRAQDKRETRQAIVTAANALFTEHGYEDFSLRQVAERIGYSPGTIYLYFNNKDDVLFHIADEGFQKFGATLREAFQKTSDPLDRLVVMGRAYLDFALENQVRYRLMFIDRPDFWRVSEDNQISPISWSQTFSIWQEAVEEAVAVGALHGDAESNADLLWAVVHGIAVLGIVMPSFGEAQQRLDQAFDRFVSNLRDTE